jgi:hypothetical protein
MQAIRITRTEVVEMIQEKYEAEGYTVLSIFPHTSGYIIEVEKEEE